VHRITFLRLVTFGEHPFYVFSRRIETRQKLLIAMFPPWIETTLPNPLREMVDK
jgi:hypothetical protein